MYMSMNMNEHWLIIQIFSFGFKTFKKKRMCASYEREFEIYARERDAYNFRLVERITKPFIMKINRKCSMCRGEPLKSTSKTRNWIKLKRFEISKNIYIFTWWNSRKEKQRELSRGKRLNVIRKENARAEYGDCIGSIRLTGRFR